MIRRFEEAPLANQRYKHRPGAYAVLVRGGQVLLTFQSAPSPEFQLPGGGIERGEHAVPALHREILEETGWRVCHLRKIGAFRRFTFMPEYDVWAEKVCHIYFGVPTICVGVPIEKDHTAVWASPEAAIDMVQNEGDRWFLNFALSR